MIGWLITQNIVLLALLAGLPTWGYTILGSAVVFSFTKVSHKLLDVMMGFAVGVMIVASFWSLLAPAIDCAHADYDGLAWLSAAIDSLSDDFSLCLADALVPHLYLGKDVSEVKGIQPKKKLSKTALLFLATTIYSLPEGLAVGVTFGALASGNMTNVVLIGVIELTTGIGLQDIPEGATSSIPIHIDGSSHWRASFMGTMPAIVEPIGAALGAAPVIAMLQITSYALALAAGAMISVVVEELIPEPQTDGNIDTVTLRLMVGFVTMMMMDVVLG